MIDVFQRELEGRFRSELPHLKEDDVRVLARIAERLVEAYHPEHIYLLGSKARGDYGADSDFNVLVVVPDTASPHRKRSLLAYEILRGTGTAADVLVWSHSTFESRLRLAASLPATVMREGKLLQAA
jgi:predicted nucleotidyltransferase